jgi:undecaprenyl pyrophosphate phosphatase UppP
VIFFRRDWVRLVTALVSSVRNRGIHTVDERLVWLLVVGTIPVGLAGLALDVMREYLGTPVPAALYSQRSSGRIADLRGRPLIAGRSTSISVGR